MLTNIFIIIIIRLLSTLTGFLQNGSTQSSDFNAAYLLAGSEIYDLAHLCRFNGTDRIIQIVLFAAFRLGWLFTDGKYAGVV